MGFNFRKSIKIGPARINLSKSGVGYSIGAKGMRYTHTPGRKKKSGKPGKVSRGALIFWAVIFLLAGLSSIGENVFSAAICIILGGGILYLVRKDRKQ